MCGIEDFLMLPRTGLGASKNFVAGQPLQRKDVNSGKMVGAIGFEPMTSTV
jgi:hypothetical protein